MMLCSCFELVFEVLLRCSYLCAFARLIVSLIGVLASLYRPGCAHIFSVVCRLFAYGFNLLEFLLCHAPSFASFVSDVSCVYDVYGLKSLDVFGRL